MAEFGSGMHHPVHTVGYRSGGGVLRMEGLLLGSLCMGLGGAFGQQALPTANL
jgi:hypothetical protein